MKTNHFIQQIIKCRLCNNETTMLGTKLCDRCYELETRIQRDLELATQIVMALQKAQAPTMNIDEFIRDGICKIITIAAETTAAITTNPDTTANVPLVFFGIEQRLLATWQAEYERLFAPTGEKNE